MFAKITPLILTYNEAPNIRRTLERLAWAREVLVLDSFSTDETLNILKEFSKVRVLQRNFDTFAGQCNFSLQQITTEWVLSLDADYVLSQDLVAEISRLNDRADVAGYTACFRYCIQGRPLRSTLYPPRTVLYRKEKACYRDEGHGHRVQIFGKVSALKSFIFHDDRKPLSHWLWAQDRYARLEAEHLLRSREPGAEEPKNVQHRTSSIGHSTSNIQHPASAVAEGVGTSTSVFASPIANYQIPTTELSWPDRVRKLIVVAPVAVFFYTLLGKGLILDGWPGWYYVFQRTLAELILSLRLIEKKLKR